MTDQSFTKIQSLEVDKNYAVDIIPNIVGVVRDVIFVNCIFWPKNAMTKFVDCEFQKCRNMQVIPFRTSCKVS